jgi:hypothetical protein
MGVFGEKMGGKVVGKCGKAFRWFVAEARKGFLETKRYLAYNKRNDIANGSAVKL